MAEPAPAVRPWVASYCGYREETPVPMRRREVPGPVVALIIELGPPISIVHPGDAATAVQHRLGFAAGLDDTFAITEHAGRSHGIQINFTPFGGRLFFGRPLEELARRVVGIDDVLGAAGRALVEQLHNAPSWDHRFELLDRVIAARAAAARGVPDYLAWAWQRIADTGGGLDIGELVDELGYSHKHVIATFRRELGLPPRLLARIVRFDRVIRRLRAGTVQRWADVAQDCGYYDQSHLVRDVREFAGCTPRELLGRALPDLGGLAEER